MEEWTFKLALFLGFCNFVYYALFNKYIKPEDLKIKTREKAKKHIYNLYKYDASCIDRLDQLLITKNKELNSI